MWDGDSLFECFEASRPRLRAVAYGLLGMLGEADSVVQATRIRLARRDAGDIREPYDWLLADVVRDCLARLRAREAHRVEPNSRWVPDPIVTLDDPEFVEDRDRAPRPATLGQLTSLERFHPKERVAFVLHVLLGESTAKVAPLAGMDAVAIEHFVARLHRRALWSPNSSEELRSSRRESAGFFLHEWKSGRFHERPSVLAFFYHELHLDLGPLVGRSGPPDDVYFGFAKAGRWLADDGWAAHVLLVNGQPGLMVMDRFRTRYVVGFDFEESSIKGIYALGDLERLSRLDLPRLTS